MGFSIGGFFRDIVAPIGLSLINPWLGAAYAGINTGIKTGSPLAGLGSAGLSIGMYGAFKGLTKGLEASSSLAPVFKDVGTRAAEAGTSTVMSRTADAGAHFGASLAGSGNPVGNVAFTNIGGHTVGRAAPAFISNVAPSASQGLNFGALKEPIGSLLPQEGISGQITQALPDFIKEQSPLMVGGAGLALKMAGTPPPAPAPFAPMQGQPTKDFSKYNYKGPLNRGAYTYADPEDIAYGRVDPDTYGYIGAKEGGTINLADGGGVMMQKGPYNLAVEKSKGTFRPTGSMVSPQMAPTISKIAQTQPMMSVNKGRLAGLAQPVAPTVPTNLPIQAPTPQPKAPMPQPNQQQNASKQAMELINRLPKKDLNVDLGQVASALGFSFNEGGTVPSPEDLPEKEFASMGIYRKPTEYEAKEMASGGEVPGMAKQAPAGITGQSSNIDASVYSTKPTKLSEQEFVDGFLSIMPNNIVGNTVRELGLGANVGNQMYQQYKNYNQPKKEMAEGGEVNSNRTLQENAFVIPADVVGHIGDGSSDAGAQRLQSFLGMNPQRYQAGGIMAGQLNGPGGGMDDLIQTSIEGKRAAAVSPEEFVVPRDIVAEIGRGSYDKGSNKLYALMRNVRQTKTGTTKQPAELTRGLGQLMRTAVA